MREFIDLLNEKALTPLELSKHGGKYLQILMQFVGNGLPVPVDPSAREVYGDYIQLDPAMLPAMQRAWSRIIYKATFQKLLLHLLMARKKKLRGVRFLRARSLQDLLVKKHTMQGILLN